MPIDAPDYVLWSQHVEVVVSSPVPVGAATEICISRLNDASDSAQVYTTVLSYTAPASTVTIIYGLELYSDNFPKTLWRLTIGGTEQWANKELPASLNMIFSDARIAAGTVVLLEGKSSDGTTVQMWGHLEGKEVS